MELHFFVLRERKNIFLARQISTRQRGAVMAFIPDRKLPDSDVSSKTSLPPGLGLFVHIFCDNSEVSTSESIHFRSS